ncbi:addiction module protein [Massilia sp. SR12]
MPSLSELQQVAIELPPEDRAKLAEILIASIQEPMSPEIERAWELEVVRRLAAYERGDEAAIPAEEVFAEARRLYP